ncbi:hypothetical protein Q9Q99_10300 [Curtobacterium flaccumfaciens]|nr:hypothetical protein Q9Q99_10300 [Curtobacterium flaccumfaciens]
MTQTGTAADDQTPANPTNTENATTAPLTRRAVRETEGRAVRKVVPVRSAPLPGGRRAAQAAAAASTAKASSVSRKRKFLAPVVLTVAAGMFRDGRGRSGLRRDVRQQLDRRRGRPASGPRHAEPGAVGVRRRGAGGHEP